MLYLDHSQVRELLQNVGQTDSDEVIVVRCVRKTKASKPGGPGIGDLHDLHVTKKPPYTPKTSEDRKSNDASSGTLTVYVTNRRDGGAPGGWRRVNLMQVRKIILHDGREFEVVES